jgi:FkbM family methyltransferase
MSVDSWKEFEDLLSDDAAPPMRLDRNYPVFIFGAGGFAADLFHALKAQGFQIGGFVQTAQNRSLYLGYPVYALADVEEDRAAIQLAVGIFNRETSFGLLENLATTAGYQKIFLPHQIYAQFQSELGWKYWMSSSEDILENIPSFSRAYELFTDEGSRQTFVRILKFRLGMDPEYASFRHSEAQYFNRLTTPALEGRRLTYIDGGAFDGDSHRELASLLPIREAYLFEPDPENYRTLVENSKSFDTGVHCLPLALSDGYRILSFGGGTGESSAISDSGGQSIATVSLDQFLPHRSIDFLKLDIEGAEADAINGAKEILQRSQPVVAMSLYHKTKDLASLPLQLNEILPDHRLHILQHMYNSFESVLYAIPRRKT